MPPKRKALASSAQNSPSKPPKRSRKASPTSPSPRPKPARKALPCKPSTPTRATRSSARRAALFSSPAPEPTVLPSPVPPSSPPAPAHVPAPASLEVEADLSSLEMDEGPSVMPLQPDILTLEIDEYQARAREYEKRIGDLEDENAQVKEMNKKVRTNLNLARTQIAANERKKDTALQAQLSLVTAQHPGEIAIITQLKKKIAELEETNQSLHAMTSKVKFTDENQHEEIDIDKEGNVLGPNNNALCVRITELDTGREEARRKGKELGEKVDELEERIQNGVIELAEANKDLQDCEDELERVKDGKASVQARLEDAIAELNKVDGLAQELMDAQREFRLVKVELGKARRGEKQARVELEKVQRSVKEARDMSYSKQKDLEAQIEEVYELEAKLESATTSVEEKSNEIAQLKADYANATASLESANYELFAKQTELEDRARKMKEANQEVEKLKQKLDKQKNLTVHLQEAADGHLKTKRDMEKMVEALTAEVWRMRERPQAISEEKEEGGSSKVGLGLDWE